MPNNIVELQGITKIYNQQSKFPTQVLFGIDLSFAKGSFNSIIGQSGSGKSHLTEHSWHARRSNRWPNRHQWREHQKR
ncbi:MAG: hypothetical protein MZU97_18175 [Bacillus subtilis]|nr:hypothetical protein [Bacillus subtilis]